MQKLIIAVLLLAVGFVGGYTLSNDRASGDSHTALSDEKHAEHAMHHDALFEVPEGTPAPSVNLEVLKDPKSGWNARITTQHFTFSPENVSRENVIGEGHAHIYVDGIKINRVYSDWYHLGALSEGTHEVTVTLNTNDHGAYAVNGERITDAVTVIVEPKATFDPGNAQMFEASIVNRALSPQTVTVTEGRSVHLKVTTDEAGEFHIAGYEIVTEMNENDTTDVLFVADKAGRYAFEIHPKEEGHMDHSSMEDIEIGSLIVNPR